MNDPIGNDPFPFTEVPQSIPSEGFLDAQAHQAFMSLTPAVLKDEQQLVNTLSVLACEQKQTDAITSIASMEGASTASPTSKPTMMATCRSDCIPAINRRASHDDDDGDNNGLCLIDSTPQPGSLVARLELALALAKAQAQCYEPCHDTSYNTTNTVTC